MRPKYTKRVHRGMLALADLVKNHPATGDEILKLPKVHFDDLFVAAHWIWNYDAYRTKKLNAAKEEEPGAGQS